MAFVPKIPDALYIGATAVDRVYQGPEQIWPEPPPPPTYLGHLRDLTPTQSNIGVTFPAVALGDGAETIIVTTTRHDDSQGGVPVVTVGGVEWPTDAKRVQRRHSMSICKGVPPSSVADVHIREDTAYGSNDSGYWTIAVYSCPAPLTEGAYDMAGSEGSGDISVSVEGAAFTVGAFFTLQVNDTGAAAMFDTHDDKYENDADRNHVNVGHWVGSGTKALTVVQSYPGAIVQTYS